VTFTSDYFEFIEEKCIQMIKDGKAYCDDTAQEQVIEPFLQLIVDEKRTYGRHRK